MKWVVIQCSNCGSHTDVQCDVKHVKATTKKGWRSYGGVIYCPKCAKTWNERNSDKELNTAEETNEWIYEKIFKARERENELHETDCQDARR